jgi:transcriptional regulator with XRE-family HTH domain
LERIQEAIQVTFEEERSKRGLSQVEIARELDVDQSVVSRRIHGGGNITLRTISDLYTAMGREPLANFRPPVNKYTRSPYNDLQGKVIGRAWDEIRRKSPGTDGHPEEGGLSVTAV